MIFWRIATPLDPLSIYIPLFAEKLTQIWIFLKNWYLLNKFKWRWEGENFPGDGIKIKSSWVIFILPFYECNNTIFEKEKKNIVVSSAKSSQIFDVL